VPANKLIQYGSLLEAEAQFFRLWLENANISDFWQKCIAPRFSTKKTPPRLYAQSRHNHVTFSITEEQAIFVQAQASVSNSNGFSIIAPMHPSTETLFYWKEGQIMALISGELPKQKQNSVRLIELFLWKVINDLKQKDLEVDTIHDEITCAYNQHYLRLLIDMEVDRGKRYGIFFSLLFLDLDNLKVVNELYGHLVGTAVLKEVTGLIKESVRRGDAVARFGGDEFVILLLHSHPEEASIVAGRILKTISNHVFLKEKNLSINISASIGITGFPDHGNTTETLIQKADIAMYRVKQSGKNGLEIYKGD